MRPDRDLARRLSFAGSELVEALVQRRYFLAQFDDRLNLLFQPADFELLLFEISVHALDRVDDQHKQQSRYGNIQRASDRGLCVSCLKPTLFFDIARDQLPPLAVGDGESAGL